MTEKIFYMTTMKVEHVFKSWKSRGGVNHTGAVKFFFQILESLLSRMSMIYQNINFNKGEQTYDILHPIYVYNFLARIVLMNSTLPHV